MSTFKSAAQLSPQSRDYLRALLIALSDSKMLLGFHYGEWTFGTPALEACIAACSMSQDEFGHLRLFHACLNTQFQEDPRQLIEHRPPAQFASVPSLDHPLRQWSDFVAVNLLTDGALTVLLTALQRSAFEPVANFIDKMVEEEKHHLRNAQGWFRTLAARNPETRVALEASCRSVLAGTLEWLGPVDHHMMRTLAQEGILNITWEELQQQFCDWIGPLAQEQHIALGLEKNGRHWHPAVVPEFRNWNYRTRRSSATQPDENLLYHLRGSKNDIFKLGE
ncbi:MAG: phenylacetate-CoA oxygenase subunit PaaI [candidate division KSB1 bacterium]|nr:phenylacetate-CoA oxygenase subunit PaaI [candidate division KSB1 bacterium]MDZ7274026.1 phenylacetate-CoA oxygenase subunit PaaI [candidate division KSB1 bacterium]MDZ7286399.1 phenylacetate-CoA oxygenase subunit PaaI [candidate division KSB1 bacterium]MDZ7296627.1 phenylacetate-CoA oxygenase subunit PaaI [candidate division KSB1 bacterium]MDZ7306849.1 phenylacetate-CoA oxygenase subunit PaaI [candidate division KSB1 bacterium]